MSLGAGAILQPARAGYRSRRAARVLLLRAAVASGSAGLALGVLWRLLAPVVQAQVVDGSVFLRGNQELAIAQDGWLVILLGLAGVTLATVQSLRPGDDDAVRALVGLGGLVLAGVVAWRVGTWLGPGSLRSQVAAGLSHPSTPLELHTPAALLVGPVLYCVTRCLAALLTTGGGRP